MEMVRGNGVFLVAVVLVGLLSTSTRAGSISYSSGTNTFATGGYMSYVTASNAGTVVNITGNAVSGNSTTVGVLSAHSGSTVNVLDGGIANGASAISATINNIHVDSVLNIYTGGSGGSVSAGNTSTANLLGGTVATFLTADKSYEEATINFYSGSVTDSIKGYREGTVNWYGGIAGTIYATDQSTFNIYGTGLAFTDTGTTSTVDSMTYELWTLAGTLQNGDALSANFYWNQSSPNVTVNLLAPTPEPASAALLLVGLGGLLMLPGRRGAVKGS